MKSTILTTTALTMLTAMPVLSQSFTERVVDTLAQQGFRAVEVKNGPTETKVEAVRGNTQLEVVYDRATGQIVEQETETFFGRIAPDKTVGVTTEDRDFSDRARDRGLDDDENDDDDEGRDHSGDDESDHDEGDESDHDEGDHDSENGESGHGGHGGDDGQGDSDGDSGGGGDGDSGGGGDGDSDDDGDSDGDGENGGND